MQLNWSCHEAEHLPHCCDKVKNTWSCAAISPYTWCGALLRTVTAFIQFLYSILFTAGAVIAE